MTTIIRGVAARSVQADTFADLTPAPFVPRMVEGEMELTFADDLGAECADAVLARLTTRDDYETANLAKLAALRTTAATGTAADVKALALALAAHLLGEAI